MIVKDDFHVVFEIGGTLRPVWYTLSRSRTVTRRPVVVFIRSMKCRAMSAVGKITPWQACVMCGNTRCSIELRLNGPADSERYEYLGPADWPALVVLLEQVLGCAVAAAPIAKHQQPLRPGYAVRPTCSHHNATLRDIGAGVVARIEMDVGMLMRHIIDPVGISFPWPAEPKSSSKDSTFRGEGRARAVKIPERLLLFRVNRNHHRQLPRTRIAGAQCTQLRVAVRIPIVFICAQCGGPV